MSEPVEIDSLPVSGTLFSLCTLVTDHDEYRIMCDSAHKAGFGEECEYLYIDNSQGNKYDGYEAVNRFLSGAKGEYIILCHQDVEFKFDDAATLTKRLEALSENDPSWALAGNAGYSSFADPAMCLSDPYGEERRKGDLPQKVRSLDENFIVVRRDANLCASHDLKGFHFYGTDLCQIAYMLGRSAYVIDFHLYHKGAGTIDWRFHEAKAQFIAKYANALSPVFIRSTCDKLFISGSSMLNALCNSKLCYRIIKTWQKLFR